MRSSELLLVTQPYPCQKIQIGLLSVKRFLSIVAMILCVLSILCTSFWLEKRVSLGVQEKVEGNLEIKGKKKKNLNSYAFWNCISWGGMRKCRKLPLQGRKAGFQNFTKHFIPSKITFCKCNRDSLLKNPDTNKYLVM